MRNSTGSLVFQGSMKLIPYNRFYIDSEKLPDEVLQRINDNTSKKKLFSFSPTKEFSGTVSNDGFQIQKNISYRNSFIPVIEGIVESSESGTIIDIKMRLNTIVFCFMCIWFVGVGIGCIAVLSNIDSFSFHALIPFGMLIFGLALVNGGFWVEASKQKIKLIELLKKN